MSRRMIGILLLVLGISVLGWGRSMSREVAQGEGKLSQVEAYEQDQRRPYGGPMRKEVRAEENETLLGKIGDQKAKIANSQTTATWLQGTGIVLFIGGLGSLIASFSLRKRK